MRIVRFTFVLFLLIPAALYAQEEKKLIQLSGKVMDEYLQPLPFAHILILNSYRGTITNNYGNFSLVVEERDSVLISSAGYKTRYITIPESPEDNFMDVNVILQVDTLVIQEAVIYPWKNYEEFRQAFLELKLPNDDMERARKNIALIRTQIIMDQEPSARANFRNIMEQQYKETFTQGTYPTYQLFNVMAWAKFFQALKRGDFRIRDE
jgi:hypothetical protein